MNWYAWGRSRACAPLSTRGGDHANELVRDHANELVRDQACRSMNWSLPINELVRVGAIKLAKYSICDFMIAPTRTSAAANLQSCPMCRGPVQSFMRVYG